MNVRNETVHVMACGARGRAPLAFTAPECIRIFFVLNFCYIFLSYIFLLDFKIRAQKFSRKLEPPLHMEVETL